VGVNENGWNDCMAKRRLVRLHFGRLLSEVKTMSVEGNRARKNRRLDMISTHLVVGSSRS
jgi:hypothetical protein